jgi:hypothetical protein
MPSQHPRPLDDLSGQPRPVPCRADGPMGRDLILEHAEEFAQLESLDNGKPRPGT